MRDACASTELPGYDRALQRVLDRVAPLEPEAVPLSAASGRVLCEPIIADRDQPPFNRSAMDGFAVRSCELVSDKWYDVVATIPAGGEPDASADLTKGVSAIATGAAVPDVYDAVIPVEQAQERDGRVRFHLKDVKPGASVHPRGADAMQGRTLIDAGTVLGPQHVGIAAAVGCVEPVVIRKPCVSILTTGDEVRPPATPTGALQPQQIRNANGPMLDALLEALDVERVDHAHVRDDPDTTLSALRKATGKSDVVLTVGGISAGKRDHVPWAAGELEYETLIKGVAIQPGKPVFIAQACDGSHRLILGLPGNPVSVLATAHLFAWPVLRKITGLGAALPWRSVELDKPVRPNPRRQAFRAAKLVEGRARVIAWQGSGDLSHTAGADGFVCLPVRDEVLAAGTRIDFLPMIGRSP